VAHRSALNTLLYGVKDLGSLKKRSGFLKIALFVKISRTWSTSCSPLKERREMLYLGNQANEIICLESSCEIENITIRDLTGSCQCKIKSELSRILEETSNVQFTFDNIGINNFPIFTCYKEGFNKNNLKSNIGFFIGIVLIVIQILSFILYIISSKPRTKVKITANPPNPTNPESPVQKNNSEMLYLENFPRQIVSKFFARMYTEETPFYSKINEALRKKENNYDIFNNNWININSSSYNSYNIYFTRKI